MEKGGRFLLHWIGVANEALRLVISECCVRNLASVGASLHQFLCNIGTSRWELRVGPITAWLDRMAGTLGGAAWDEPGSIASCTLTSADPALLGVYPDEKVHEIHGSRHALDYNNKVLGLRGGGMRNTVHGTRTTFLRGGSSASTVALVGQTLRFSSKVCLKRNANRLRTRNLILQDLFLWCQLEMSIWYVWLDLTSLRFENVAPKQLMETQHVCLCAFTTGNLSRK